MAGTHSFLTSLRATIKAFDDETLAALANRGLLRRAQKDLEASLPELVDIADDHVQVLVGGEWVTIPSLPSKSSCTCPAAGCCRHILGALLLLRDHLPDEATSPESNDTVDASSAPVAAEQVAAVPNIADVLASLSDADLEQWAGKPLIRKARKMLGALVDVDIETGESLIVRFPSRNITCRWIPSHGLTGLICSCQAETICEHAVAAVIAFQVSIGVRKEVDKAEALQAASGAPRTRGEVLESVAAIVREMISLGLARLSKATASRLVTLAVSAHGVDLPRLESMLKALAGEIQLVLRRDAQAGTASVLLLAARIEALRMALTNNQTAALVGQHRSQYYEVGQLLLLGLGARLWSTKGGFHGLTVYFWDTEHEVWLTWSESRPADQVGFHPHRRFFMDGPWSGCRSPQQTSRSRVRLSGAWRNEQGRLSGRPGTLGYLEGNSHPRNVKAVICDWSLLAERAQVLFGGRLSANPENLDLVLLYPKEWGTAHFDNTRQQLVRPVYDEKGSAVDLWLPFTGDNQIAVPRLEQFKASETSYVLGSLQLVAGRLCVLPITLHQDGKSWHLNIVEDESRTDEWWFTGHEMPEETSEAEVADEFPSSGEENSAVHHLLVTAQAELEAMAEAGIAARRNQDLLRSVQEKLQALGLTACAAPLSKLLAAVTNSAHLADRDASLTASGALLHVYYLLRLAAEQETLVAAAQQMTSSRPTQ